MDFRRWLKHETNSQTNDGRARKRIKLVTVVGVDATHLSPILRVPKVSAGELAAGLLGYSGNHMLLPKKLLERTAGKSEAATPGATRDGRRGNPRRPGR